MSGKGRIEATGSISTAFGSLAEKYEKRTGGAHNNIARQLMCMSMPFTDESHVLDNATGTGIVIEELQNHISTTMPNSSIKIAVTAADAANAMIEYLNAKIERKNASEAWPNLESIQTHVVRAEELDSRVVPDDSITHAYMNFGVFFCSDPVLAVSNIHRCLKPGAKAFITTWRNLDFMSPVHEAHEALYPEEPRFSMPFDTSWENQEHVIEIFVKSGFTRENVECVEADTFMKFTNVQEMASKSTELFTTLVKGAKGWENLGARDAFEAKLEETLLASDGCECSETGGASLKMEAWIWICTKQRGYVVTA